MKTLCHTVCELSASLHFSQFFFPPLRMCTYSPPVCADARAWGNCGWWLACLPLSARAADEDVWPVERTGLGESVCWYKVSDPFCSLFGMVLPRTNNNQPLCALPLDPNTARILEQSAFSSSWDWSIDLVLICRIMFCFLCVPVWLLVCMFLFHVSLLNAKIYAEVDY